APPGGRGQPAVTRPGACGDMGAPGGGPGSARACEVCHEVVITGPPGAGTPPAYPERCHTPTPPRYAGLHLEETWTRAYLHLGAPPAAARAMSCHLASLVPTRSPHRRRRPSRSRSCCYRTTTELGSGPQAFG